MITRKLKKKITNFIKKQTIIYEKQLEKIEKEEIKEKVIVKQKVIKKKLKLGP